MEIQVVPRINWSQQRTKTKGERKTNGKQNATRSTKISKCLSNAPLKDVVRLLTRIYAFG